MNYGDVEVDSERYEPLIINDLKKEKNYTIDILEKLILSYFLNNDDRASFDDLKFYLNDYNITSIKNDNIYNVIKDLGIFKREGELKGNRIIKVNMGKVRYRCKKRGIEKRTHDQYGNIKIPGLRETGFKKFGIGIGNEVKSPDPFRRNKWKSVEGHFYNPYRDKIEVGKLSGDNWEDLPPINIGSPGIRDQNNYKRIIWDVMNNITYQVNGFDYQVGTTASYNSFHSNKSFSNKINIYLPELEDTIFELNNIGIDLQSFHKRKAVELLAKFHMKHFQGILKSKECGKFNKKSYSPVVNASFVLYVLEIDGFKIPNTRECKFLRSIGWSLCRYNLIKTIIDENL